MLRNIDASSDGFYRQLVALHARADAFPPGRYRVARLPPGEDGCAVWSGVGAGVRIGLWPLGTVLELRETRAAATGEAMGRIVHPMSGWVRLEQGGVPLLEAAEPRLPYEPRLEEAAEVVQPARSIFACPCCGRLFHAFQERGHWHTVAAGGSLMRARATASPSTPPLRMLQ
mmetsp:Transcript_51142/g.147587  ORF Transcript_51142/g.147587 Transcript_51142/m.147587 type:complete len:172 (+) Transcript_51142:106-621(+)